MAAVLTEPVSGPVAWNGRDLARAGDWIYHLPPQAIAELDAAMRMVKARGIPLDSVTRADFPLPTFGAGLTALATELEWGRGFTLIRGLPAQRFSRHELEIIFWGIGTYLGRAVPQNARGELLGHVRDEGLTLDNPLARGYQTRASQSMHVDRCDVVGLLCVRPAKSGGTSRIVSSAAIYNELLRRHPWYVGVLYKSFAVDMRGEERPGDPPVYYRPVFSYHDGRLTCGANYTYIRDGQQRIGAPLSAVETEALDTFYALAEELLLAMDLVPGDIQFLNNYVILHDRTGYDDHPEPERKRHMLRLWLAVPEPRKLAPGVNWHYVGRSAAPAGA